MGIIDDGDEHFTKMIEAEGFFDEAFFAPEVTAVEVYRESLAEDAESAEVSVKGAVNDRSDKAFWVVVFDGLFDDGFASAGFAEEQAKAALL